MVFICPTVTQREGIRQVCSLGSRNLVDYLRIMGARVRHCVSSRDTSIIPMSSEHFPCQYVIQVRLMHKLRELIMLQF